MTDKFGQCPKESGSSRTRCPMPPMAMKGGQRVRFVLGNDPKSEVNRRSLYNQNKNNRCIWRHFMLSVERTRFFSHPYSILGVFSASRPRSLSLRVNVFYLPIKRQSLLKSKIYNYRSIVSFIKTLRQQYITNGEPYNVSLIHVLRRFRLLDIVRGIASDTSTPEVKLF